MCLFLQEEASEILHSYQEKSTSSPAFLEDSSHEDPENVDMVSAEEPTTLLVDVKYI